MKDALSSRERQAPADRTAIRQQSRWESVILGLFVGEDQPVLKGDADEIGQVTHF